MPKKPTRRFLKLDTNEVSLVDVPANEVPFLVTKNQDQMENDNMSAQAGNQNIDGESVQVQVDGSESSVQKAIEHVNSIVENITKVVTVKNQGAEGNEQDNAQSADSGDTTDVSKATIKSVLSALGMSGDDMKKACDKLKAAGFNPNQQFPSAQPPVKKDAKGEGSEGETETQKSDTDSVVQDQPLTMQSLAEAVQKAAAFTPSRIEQLKNAQEILKLVLEAVAPNTSPKTKVPGVESHSNPSAVSDLSQPTKKPVMKNADDNGEFVTALKALADGVKTLTERVENIEKTRNASNSVEDDGDTDTNTDTQKSKGLWNGLL
jgi:hypothetical protein